LEFYCRNIQGSNCCYCNRTY